MSIYGGYGSTRVDRTSVDVDVEWRWSMRIESHDAFDAILRGTWHLSARSLSAAFLRALALASSAGILGAYARDVLPQDDASRPIIERARIWRDHLRDPDAAFEEYIPHQHQLRERVRQRWCSAKRSG